MRQELRLKSRRNPSEFRTKYQLDRAIRTTRRASPCNGSRVCVFRNAQSSQQRAVARDTRATAPRPAPGAHVPSAVASLIALVLVAAPGPEPGCVAASGRERSHLVELYTSEGCSSCPPAERWMSSLVGDDTQVGLEFHIDGWDSLGWPDPFADPRWSDRQRTLAERGSAGIVYTPQIAVDGRIWKNWPAKPAPTVATVARPALTLAVARDNGLRATVDGDATTLATYRSYIALTENGLTSEVAAGENRGKRLDHDQVVRDFAGPLAFPHAEATLEPPPRFDVSKASLVAFAENADGDVVQVVRLPLAHCPLTATTEKP
jgi:hypothetical protein